MTELTKQQQESRQKLKAAAAEIRAIIHRYDIAGYVVLQAPGMGEVITELNPSYSCLVVRDDGHLRLRSKLADYHGNAERMQHDRAHTAGMLGIMAEMTGHQALWFLQASKWIDDKLGAEHSASEFIPDD